MITKARIDEIAAKLRKKPAVPTPEKMHTKREAVQMLKPVIASLKKKGYSLQQISEFLKDEKIEVTQSTLRTYLQNDQSAKRSNSRQTIQTSESE